MFSSRRSLISFGMEVSEEDKTFIANYYKYAFVGLMLDWIRGDMGLAQMSAQAVGGAVGHNPISIIIPCHRVVGSSGSLTGYAGGIDKKILLLRHEGADLSALFVPKKGTAL